MSPHAARRRPGAGLLALCLLSATACQQQMAEQPSYRPLAPSGFFPDGRSARPLVPGTVPRGQLQTDAPLYTGKDEGGNSVTEFPFEMTREVLERGRQRYNIFCSVCHGVSGYGDGRIVQRGFTKPPYFHVVRDRDGHIDEDSYSRARLRRGEKVPLRDMPVGHYFGVITRGFGAMPDYSEQVPVRDRWAIIGYVRALQYSQSPEVRAKFEKGGKK